MISLNKSRASEDPSSNPVGGDRRISNDTFCFFCYSNHVERSTTGVAPNVSDRRGETVALPKVAFLVLIVIDSNSVLAQDCPLNMTTLSQN